MADVAKPVRRRIIPQQIITPTKSQQESEALSPLATATQQVEITDLKEHSAVAAELLGPGRKIYIDLAEYQREQKAVDWKEVSSGGNRSPGDDPVITSRWLLLQLHLRNPLTFPIVQLQLLKERGVKIPRPGRAAKDDALPGANRFAAPAREPLNPLARVILKLERTTGMNYVPGDDSDEEPPAQDAPADASSDSEPEGPEGEGAGTGADGEAQKEKDAGAKAGGKRGKREGGNDYDYMDDFIDDEEFIEMFEKADKRKLKYSGFFISQGTIDRTDELMEEAIPDKPEKGSRKRKADANGGDSGAPGASGSELDKVRV